jgi:holo-[acyl-carrier protein] synthase
MAEAIGIDIIEISRIEAARQRYGKRFVRRVLGPEELGLYESRVDKSQFLAGRFACKEAVIKALGHYLTDRPPLNRLQIINDNSGRPELLLPVEIHAQLKNVRILLSISHDRTSAVGMAVISRGA